MEDPAIVELYWQRSEQAIEESQRKYGAYCRSVARAVCGSDEDAEECVSDAWLAAWNSMPDKRPNRLGIYLGCLTRHIAIDRLRAARAEKRGGGETALALDELAECLPAGTDPEGELEAKELRAAIAEFVGTLTETERHVFLGRYWKLLPVETIAARLGWSGNRTRSLLFRLRRRLGKRLKEEGLL